MEASHVPERASGAPEETRPGEVASWRRPSRTPKRSKQVSRPWREYFRPAVMYPLLHGLARRAVVGFLLLLFLFTDLIAS